MIRRSRAPTYSSLSSPGKQPTRAMTLVEVIVAMLIITLFATSAFSLVNQQQRRFLTEYYTLEANRVANTIAEHSMQVAYPNNFNPTFIMTSDTNTGWVWTATEPALLHLASGGNRDASFTYLPSTSAVIYRKSVAVHSPATLGTAQILDVIVSWRFSGRNFQVVVPVVRGGN